jgi:L-alanine-DL-glutamate epimerase-like enolase superfamily enzyme
LPIERVSYDAPIKRVADIGDTRTINVKPSRIGALRPLLEIYEHCEANGIAMYGGGMGELGPARRQVQLLASLFHPDAPNDVAPPPFNLPEPVPGLSPSPLDVSMQPPGFRLK